MWLQAVRIATEIGDLSSLLPPDISSLVDAPYTYHEAIIAAIGFNSFAELPEEERPPKSIWLDNDKMVRFWGEVKRLRKLKSEGVDTSKMTERNALLDLLE